MTVAKVRQGEDMIVSASGWNELADVAAAHRGSSRGAGRRRSRVGKYASGLVELKNSTGTDFARFDAVRVGASLVTAADGANEWAIKPKHYGLTPSTFSDLGRVAVLLEPIAAGSTGRGVISGDVQTKVFVNEEWHEFADVDAVAGGRLLQSTASGSASCQILEKEAGTGTKWATVRLSNAGQFHLVGKPTGYGVTAATETGGVLTPGTGTIQVYRLDESSGGLVPYLYDGNPCLLDVYNLGGEISTGTWVLPHCDRWGVWWVKELVDVGLFYRDYAVSKDIPYGIDAIDLDTGYLNVPFSAGFVLAKGVGTWSSRDCAFECTTAGWYRADALWGFATGNAKTTHFGMKCYNSTPSLTGNYYCYAAHPEDAEQDQANLYTVHEFAVGDKVYFTCAVTGTWSGASGQARLNELSVILKRWH